MKWAYFFDLSTFEIRHFWSRPAIWTTSNKNMVFKAKIGEKWSDFHFLKFCRQLCLFGT